MYAQASDLGSSCDDSCAAVVSADREVLSNVVLRQDHAATRGIHPLLAAQGHHRNVPLAVARALAEAGASIDNIDGIAVTQGPGMPSCLAVGMSAAKPAASSITKRFMRISRS